MFLSIRHRSFLLPALCGLLALLLGQGQWVLLQGVAWAEMLLDAERGATLMERAENTFSGTRPCELCVMVQEGMQAAPADADSPVPRDTRDVPPWAFVTELIPHVDSPLAGLRTYDTAWSAPPSAPLYPPVTPPPISG